MPPPSSTSTNTLDSRSNFKVADLAPISIYKESDKLTRKAMREEYLLYLAKHSSGLEALGIQRLATSILSTKTSLPHMDTCRTCDGLPLSLHVLDVSTQQSCSLLRAFCQPHSLKLDGTSTSSYASTVSDSVGHLTQDFSQMNYQFAFVGSQGTPKAFGVQRKACDGRIFSRNPSMRSPSSTAASSDEFGSRFSKDSRPASIPSVLGMSSSIPCICLTTTADEIPLGATWFKTTPPIRHETHQNALWNALREGVVQSISSSHRPVDPRDKV